MRSPTPPTSTTSSNHLTANGNNSPVTSARPRFARAPRKARHTHGLERGTRMKGDNTSTIGSQLTRIVLIPGLCFLALWLVVAAAGTVQAVQLMGAVGQAREGTEVFSRVAEELREERRQALIHLGRTENGEPADTLPEQIRSAV